MMTLSIRRLLLSCLVFMLFAAVNAPGAAADTPEFFGLLRARDLTPFGYLRLDMRPGSAGSLPPGSWAIETELAYQNTWASSPAVEHYLTALTGRRELGPKELQDIRDLPGENYLLDLELAQLDVTLHHQINADWAAYVIVSGVHYGGGFLDGAIEKFHDTFGLGDFGRPAASRNDVNILLDLKSTQFAAFEAPTSGGLLDPTIGVRYSGLSTSPKWRVVLESAIKIPVGASRSLLSTGRTDFGLQATLQHFSKRQAVHASLSGVFYAGAGGTVPSDSQFIPTLILGYEPRLTVRTNAILQAYVSPSAYEREQTDLHELLATKYQLSFGIRHRRGPYLFTMAITENLQNINNTPDIGLQLGWSYAPAWPLPVSD